MVGIATRNEHFGIGHDRRGDRPIGFQAYSATQRRRAHREQLRCRDGTLDSGPSMEGVGRNLLMDMGYRCDDLPDYGLINVFRDAWCKANALYRALPATRVIERNVITVYLVYRTVGQSVARQVAVPVISTTIFTGPRDIRRLPSRPAIC